MTTCVSLAELGAAGINFRPAEAVALVSDICRQYLSGHLRGIPSSAIVCLTRDGEIVARGPMTTGEASVARAAHLLVTLLGDVDAPAEYRASGALRLVIARALGTLDLPPYPSLDEFCAALSRFTALDVRDTARTLMRAWERARVVRYAREAGLDEELMLSAARPLIDEAYPPATVLVRCVPEPLTTIDPIAHSATRPAWASWALAGVAAGLLALATFAVGGESLQVHGASTAPPGALASVHRESSGAAVSPPFRRPQVDGHAARATRPRFARPAAVPRRAGAAVAPSRARAGAAPERVPDAAAPQPADPEERVAPAPATLHRPFFSRELFRIVIR